jgi:hypothetical protein
MSPSRRFDELNVEANAIFHPTDASLDDIPNSELVVELSRRHHFPFV